VWGDGVLLEQFDADRCAIIEPRRSDADIPADGLPETCICPFDQSILDGMLANGQLTEIGAILSVNGREPLYSFAYEGHVFAVILARLGAPSVVGTFEELHHFGVTSVVVFGPCGVINTEQAPDRLVIPTAALRDEGTSYHYAPAADVISAQQHSIALMEEVFEDSGLSYEEGTTWTTDAFFRETREKTKQRAQQGARFVDMEASALMAWSQFRAVDLYQFFYTADCIDREGWMQRKEQRVAPLNDFFDVALSIAVRASQRS
jgi:uridine phosphorylase